MLTNDEAKMLKLIAAYNDCTEEQAKAAIVKQFLNDLVNDETAYIAQLMLTVPIEKEKEELPNMMLFKTETHEKPRKKPGRKPKTLKEFVDDTAMEVRQADKMSKDEFVEYFGGKG